MSVELINLFYFGFFLLGIASANAVIEGFRR